MCLDDWFKIDSRYIGSMIHRVTDNRDRPGVIKESLRRVTDTKRRCVVSGKMKEDSGTRVNRGRDRKHDSMRGGYAYKYKYVYTACWLLRERGGGEEGQ